MAKRNREKLMHQSMYELLAWWNGGTNIIYTDKSMEKPNNHKEVEEDADN